MPDSIRSAILRLLMKLSRESLPVMEIGETARFIPAFSLLG
jgi:hypothetical protein